MTTSDPDKMTEHNLILIAATINARRERFIGDLPSRKVMQTTLDQLAHEMSLTFYVGRGEDESARQQFMERAGYLHYSNETYLTLPPKGGSK